MMSYRALKRCIQLLNDGYIQPPRTIHVKGPASINEAFHSGPSDLGAGSYVIAYEESDSFQVSYVCLQSRGYGL